MWSLRSMTKLWLPSDDKGKEKCTITLVKRNWGSGCSPKPPLSSPRTMTSLMHSASWSLLSYVGWMSSRDCWLKSLSWKSCTRACWAS
uniref:Uncharacterized protein n=1 Tax=Pyxicephalus adspersus TaxID=30357 RepID=A0AAV2ZMN5_PYXAD|nr:TPA: hypothetical protein GDO54_004782 [Pyxicephalus adspersus]